MKVAILLTISTIIGAVGGSMAYGPNPLYYTPTTASPWRAGHPPSHGYRPQGHYHRPTPPSPWAPNSRPSASAQSQRLAVRQWSNWGTWGTCSASCDGGEQRRYRSCHVNSGARYQQSLNRCYGGTFQSRTCYQRCCKVDGLWGQWSNWVGYHSASYQQMRTRSCNKPIPSCGGSQCNGSATETRLISPPAPRARTPRPRTPPPRTSRPRTSRPRTSRPRTLRPRTSRPRTPRYRPQRYRTPRYRPQRPAPRRWG